MIRLAASQRPSWAMCFLGAGFFAAVAISPEIAQAACLVGPATVCPSPGTSCIISSTFNLGNDCNLDLHDKDVTVTSSGKLNGTGAAPITLSISFNTLNLIGEINAPGGTVTLTVTGALTTAASSIIDVTALTGATMPGTLTINAASATFNDNITANGGGGARHGGTVTINANSISVRAQILANGASGGASGDGAGGTITLHSLAGAVDVVNTGLTKTGLLSANGAGIGAPGGEIFLDALGAITVGGELRANGNAGGSGGSITLSSTSTVNVNSPLTASGGGTAAPGGTITVGSADTMTLNAAITADGTSSGAGGTLNFTTTGTGTINFQSTAPLRVTTTGTANGGSITARGSTVTSASAWNLNGASIAGGGGSVIIEGRDNGVSLTSVASINGRGVGGLPGGNINISGKGPIDLRGTMDVGAGTSSPGGVITVVGHVHGTMTVAGTVRTRGATSGGQITLREACDLTVTGLLDGGRNTYGYHGSFHSTGATLTGIAAEGGNILQCPCPDSDVNGTCDASTCTISPIVAGGSITPAFTNQPSIQVACIGCPNNALDPGEECDDGNYDNNDTCTNSCDSTCGNGNPNPGEDCDLGLNNGSPDTCCTIDCEFRPTNDPCLSDGNLCTNDVCNATGTCTHPNNTVACDDGNLCTVGDMCSAGSCNGTNNCAKAEMALLIDTSGSMGWTTAGAPTSVPDDQRIALARASASAFIDMLEAITRADAASAGQGSFGIAQFPLQPWVAPGCVGQVVTGMTNVTTGKTAAKTTTLPGLVPQGNTPLLAGLSTANTMFSPNTNRAIVLLSDGYHNCPNVVQPTDSQVTTVLNALQSTGPNDVDVYAVGFGNSADAPLPLLAKIAGDTDGAYHDATINLGYVPGSAWDAAAALNAAFKSVLSNSFGLDAPADPLGEVAGQATVVDNVRIIERDRMLLAFLSWRTSDANRLRLRLVASDGHVVSSTDPGVSASSGNQYQMLAVYPEFLNQPGKVGATPWRIEIDADGVPAGESEKYQYSVLVDSTLKMKAKVEPRSISTGDTVTLTARLTDGGPPLTGITNVQVHVARPSDGLGNVLHKNAIPADVLKRAAARVVGEPKSATALRAGLLAQNGITADGRIQPYAIPMRDDGTNGDEKPDDGIYTAQVSDTIREGTYAFHFTATGVTGDGVAFERETTIERHVSLELDTIQSTVVITPQQDNRYLVTVTPRDRFGNYLGPDRGGALALEPSRGKLVNTLADDGAGSYTQILELPDDVSVHEVTVDVVNAGSTSKPTRDDDDDCAFVRFFKRLFHCDDD